MAIILMIFLRVLPKIFLWPHYSGPQELGGPGSLNRLNPRFLRHWILNSKGNPFGWGAKYTGVGKIYDFRLKSLSISERIQDRTIVAMER